MSLYQKEIDPVFNFHNKTFTLLENSEKGTVNADTIFEYQQDGNLVTADYHGGLIRYGSIIARLHDDKLHLRYQCLTTDDELKSGKAIANITYDKNERILLQLNWEWIGGVEGKGTSVYIEV